MPGVIRSDRSSCTAPITNVARRVVPPRTGLVSRMSRTVRPAIIAQFR